MLGRCFSEDRRVELYDRTIERFVGHRDLPKSAVAACVAIHEYLHAILAERYGRACSALQEETIEVLIDIVSGIAVRHVSWIMGPCDTEHAVWKSWVALDSARYCVLKAVEAASDTWAAALADLVFAYGEAGRLFVMPLAQRVEKYMEKREGLLCCV